MAVLCAWASANEYGKTTGGKAGDQTGKEVKCGNIYNFGQTRVYRCADRKYAVKIGAAAKAIALNNNFGYCQGHRITSYNALKNANWIVANVKTPVEIDCSMLGGCSVNVAYGKQLISSSVYSGNIGSALLATGLFKELKASKYLGKSEYIECGDIIVAPGKHVIVAYTDGSKTTQNTITTTIHGVTSGNKLVKHGQQEAIKFTGVKIATDGLVGSETNMMKAKVLQHAINLDYKSGLVEDGKFGSASKKALGSHYVKTGETQCMVTAAEILMYLNGFNPNGVEHPGTYGSGLVAASKKKFGDDGLRITASEFLQLL